MHYDYPLGCRANGRVGLLTSNCERPTHTCALGLAGRLLSVARNPRGRQVVAECADNEIGRKYAADLEKGATGAVTAWASGYVESFTSWSYAKDAFDKWAAIFARRFAEVRGMTPQS